MKKCEICGSTNKIYLHKQSGKDLCSKHHYLVNKYGCVPERTQYTPNEVILHDEYAEIITYTKKGNPSYVIKVDKDDVCLLENYKISATKRDITYNVTAYVNGRNVRLGSLLLNSNSNSNNKTIFLNKDTLDFRRSNIKIGTQSNALQNSKISKSNTSGIKGVYRRKQGKWCAEITVNRKKIYLGLFEDLDDAITARKTAEEKYFNVSSLKSVEQPGKKTKFKGVSYDKKRKHNKPWIAKINNEIIGYFKKEREAAFEYDKVALELYGESAILNLVAFCNYCKDVFVKKRSDQVNCSKECYVEQNLRSNSDRYLKNKEKYKEYAKKYYQSSYKKVLEDRIKTRAENRLCIGCGEQMHEGDNRRCCPKCISHVVEHTRKKQAKNRELGRCTVCGRKRGYRINGQQSAYCQHHYDIFREYSLKRYLLKRTGLKFARTERGKNDDN